MSYLSGGAQKPDCFGDDAELSDSSRHCVVCPYRADCAATIRKTLDRVSHRNAQTEKVAQMPAPRKYTYTPSATTSRYATKPSTQQASGSAMIRPVKFNHTKPLVGQYVTYVGFDVAESIAGRAVDLIRSCRDEYERELLGDSSDDQ